jgi:hypothetical protein
MQTTQNQKGRNAEESARGRYLGWPDQLPALQSGPWKGRVSLCNRYRIVAGALTICGILVTYQLVAGVETFATPWWVNLLLVVPLVAYGVWRRRGLALRRSTLLTTAVFGSAFGFVEASVVVYLGAASGLLPGYTGTLEEVRRLARGAYQPSQVLTQVPQSLLTIEPFREAATVIMLVAVALLSATSRRERCAAFLWTFAAWDICYYVALWATVRWPPSLSAPDVLFLVPVPWLAPVWFPLLVSTLAIAAVLLARGRPTITSTHGGR